MSKDTRVVVTTVAAEEFDALAVRFAGRSANLARSLVLGYRELKRRISKNSEIGQIYEEYTEKFGVEFHVTRILVGGDSVRVFYLRESDRCTIFWFWNTFHPEDELALRDSLEPFVRVEQGISCYLRIVPDDRDLNYGKYFTESEEKKQLKLRIIKDRGVRPTHLTLEMKALG